MNIPISETVEDGLGLLGIIQRFELRAHGVGTSGYRQRQHQDW